MVAVTGPDVMQHLVLLATRAPSIHNTQPWRLVRTREGLDVGVDRARQLQAVDPMGRQMLVSCGALVHHLIVAAPALSLDPHVTLLPDPDDNDLVARLSTTEVAGPPCESDVRRAEAILHRSTDRTRFDDAALGDDAYEVMWRAVEGQGAMLLRIRDEDRIAVEVLVEHAERELLGDDAYVRELDHWVFDPHLQDERPDGIPVAAVAPGPGRAEEISGRRFVPRRTKERHEGVRASERPELLLLTTVADEPADWLRAGMALSALLLDATEIGVSAQPIGQVTDIAYERNRLRAELGVVGVPQLLLRVGRRAGRPMLRSPRRDVGAVLLS
jgi:hypothetical protein